MVSKKVLTAIRAALQNGLRPETQYRSISLLSNGEIAFEHSCLGSKRAGELFPSTAEQFAEKTRTALKSAVGLDTEVVSAWNAGAPYPSQEVYQVCILRPKGGATL